jgi:hypothetical protein
MLRYLPIGPIPPRRSYFIRGLRARGGQGVSSAVTQCKARLADEETMTSTTYCTLPHRTTSRTADRWKPRNSNEFTLKQQNTRSIMEVAARVPLINSGFNDHIVAVVLRCFRIGESGFRASAVTVYPTWTLSPLAFFRVGALAGRGHCPVVRSHWNYHSATVVLMNVLLCATGAGASGMSSFARLSYICFCCACSLTNSSRRRRRILSASVAVWCRCGQGCGVPRLIMFSSDMYAKMYALQYAECHIVSYPLPCAAPRL